MASDEQNLSVPYQAAVQHWIHAEQTRWTLLYNYFMGSSILVLAWAGVFAAANPPYRAFVLIILALCGLLISFIWILLVHRANGFVHEYSLLGQRLEQSLAQEPSSGTMADYPFTAAHTHRSKLSGLAKVLNSRRAVVVVPSLFAALYVFLFAVATRNLTQIQELGSDSHDTLQRSITRGPESIAFYAFIFAALYALLDSTLGVYDWFCERRPWLRVIVKVLVFCILFLIVMASPWVHNVLSKLLGWLEVER